MSEEGAGSGLDVDLEQVRLDRWYDEFLGSVAEVELLSSAFGPRGLGYLMLAGVRLESVSYDRADPGSSVVDVLLPDGRVARAPARLLSRRAIEALAEQVALEGPLPSSESPDAIRAYLGGRFVLLAAMHELSLRRLVIAPGVDPAIEIEHEADQFRVTVAVARALVLEKLEDDLRALDELQLDAERLAEAKRASERGDHATVVTLLEPIAGPLVSLLRSGATARMSTEERETLIDALDLLGLAQRAGGELESAETLFRLGVQGCRGEPEVARLYVRLGMLALDRGAAGEAIGTLRHAKTLGASVVEVAPLLSRALAIRGRHVAALVVRDEGLAAGASPSAFSVETAASAAALGDTYVAFRARLDARAVDGTLAT